MPPASVIFRHYRDKESREEESRHSGEDTHNAHAMLGGESLLDGGAPAGITEDTKHDDAEAVAQSLRVDETLKRFA